MKSVKKYICKSVFLSLWIVFLGFPLLVGMVLGIVCTGFRVGWDAAYEVVDKLNDAADWRKD